MVPEVMGMLLSLSFIGIWGFILIDHIFFPIQHNFPQRPPLFTVIKNYIHAFKLSLLPLFLALRTTFSVLIILGIAYITGFPGLSSMVSAIVSAVVISTPISDKLKSGLSNRILGTVFGAVLGCCFVLLLSQFPFFWLMILCFIFGTGWIAYLAQKSMSFASMGMQAGFAFMIVFSPGAALSIDGLSGGLSRLFGILYGCLVAYLISMAIRLPAEKKT